MNSDMEAPTAFTAAERNYIRLQLDMFFSTLPSVADGFQLKTWCGSPWRDSPSCRQPPKVWWSAA
jgi:hypothetical protein